MANSHIPSVKRQWMSEYSIWVMAKQRCYNQKNKEYRWYGARGISMCDRWRNSFPNFLADMGPRPQGPVSGRRFYSIERVNNDGNYEPANCRWATSMEQSRNRRPRRAYIRQDLTGGTYGRLTVLEAVPKLAYGRTQWYCRCACGKVLIANSHALKSGNTRSCGCLKRMPHKYPAQRKSRILHRNAKRPTARSS